MSWDLARTLPHCGNPPAPPICSSGKSHHGGWARKKETINNAPRPGEGARRSAFSGSFRPKADLASHPLASLRHAQLYPKPQSALHAVRPGPVAPPPFLHHHGHRRSETVLLPEWRPRVQRPALWQRDGGQRLLCPGPDLSRQQLLSERRHQPAFHARARQLYGPELAQRPMSRQMPRL